MLASFVDAPLQDPQLVYELKDDSIRVIADVPHRGQSRLAAASVPASRRASLLAGLMAVVVPFSAGAQMPARRATPPHASVELIAAAESAAAGADLWVAVRFQLEHGWHIYWQNPGDSGSAPTFAWQVPEGVRAGEVEWPAPSRIEVDTLINYGYEGEVVLPVPLRMAPGVRAGEPITVGLGLKYLVCRDMCVSGRAALALALPLTPADVADLARWKSSIDEARARVPKPAPVSWKARAVSQPDVFVITVETGARESTGVFFPLVVSQVNDSAPQPVRALARGLEITLRKSDQLRADPRELKGVLALSPDRTYVITAAVQETPPLQENEIR